MKNFSSVMKRKLRSFDKSSSVISTSKKKDSSLKIKDNSKKIKKSNKGVERNSKDVDRKPKGIVINEGVVALLPENAPEVGRFEKGKKRVSDGKKKDGKKKVKCMKLDDEVDAAPATKRWDYLVPPSRHFGCRMVKNTNFDTIANIKRVLNQQQFDMLRMSRFGHFLDLQSCQIQPKVIHLLLLREVLVDDDPKVLWLNLNGNFVRFGLDEFALITGLKCNSGPSMHLYSSVNNGLRDRYFPGGGTITPNRISVRFNIGLFEDNGDAVKMAILYMLTNFLFGYSADYNVPKYIISVIDAGDFDVYSFGIDVFDYTISNLKGLLSQKSTLPDELCSYNVYGFYLALQYWFFELCGLCKDSCAQRLSGSEIPRMLNWIPNLFPRTKQLKNDIFSLPRDRMQIENLYPTDEERRILNLDGLFTYKKGEERSHFEDVRSDHTARSDTVACSGSDSIPRSIVEHMLRKLYERQDNFERKIEAKLNCLISSVDSVFARVSEMNVLPPMNKQNDDDKYKAGSSKAAEGYISDHEVNLNVDGDGDSSNDGGEEEDQFVMRRAEHVDDVAVGVEGVDVEKSNVDVVEGGQDAHVVAVDVEGVECRCS